LDRNNTNLIDEFDFNIPFKNNSASNESQITSIFIETILFFNPFDKKFFEHLMNLSSDLYNEQLKKLIPRTDLQNVSIFDLLLFYSQILIIHQDILAQF
jgi:hypothetical protein